MVKRQKTILRFSSLLKLLPTREREMFTLLLTTFFLLRRRLLQNDDIWSFILNLLLIPGSAVAAPDNSPTEMLLVF